MSSKVDAVPVVNPVATTIKAPDLKQAIDRVLFATTKDPSRYRLDVVRFTSDGETLKLEATDGRRISVATIAVELPLFEILVSAEDCKSVKKLCGHKRDLITVGATSEGLTFENSKAENIEVNSTGDLSQFPPTDHALATETTGTIPVLDLVEFKRGIRLAQIARLDGERNCKAHGSNLIRVISTGRKLTVFGKSRQNRTRSVFQMDSDDRATGASVALNANFLLDLLRVIPKNEPFEFRCWKNGTEGVAVKTQGFTHILCGISEKRGVSH